jgi:NRPS condensation-like uncharacterized protein
MRRAKGTTVSLNCVDKGLFALHSKGDPMVLHYVLTLAGAVDPAALRSALATVMLRHPVLRSTIRTGLLHQCREVQDIRSRDVLTLCGLAGAQTERGTDPEQINALYERRLSEWMNRPLDPSREWPCRVLLLGRTLQDFSLVFTVHHSATDGLGAFRFIEEVIQEYNGTADNSTPSACCLTDEKGDELVALARASRPGISHFYLKIVASLFHRFLIAPLSPNTRVCRTRSGKGAEIDFCQGTLTPYELKQIRSRSKASGVTVNDVLLAAGFRTIEQWNAVHGKPSRKISIMVPVDVGRATSFPINGNRVAFISVAAAQHERADHEALLRAVHQKTANMLRNGTAFSIVYAVYLCCCYSPQIAKAVARFLLATRVYLDTILLTNLGAIQPRGSASTEVRNMGNAAITSIAVLAPVVSPMGMSLSADTYNDHLHVSLAYKTSHFSHAEARLLLSLFLHEMRGYQRTAQGVLAPSVTERATREAVPATRPC